MNIVSFVEGPLLWTAFVVFLSGIAVRLVSFLASIIRSSRGREFRRKYLASCYLRFFLPFHNGFGKKPFYGIFRYLFHFCLLVVPVFLFAHVVLWEESRLALSWHTMPDEWADWMTRFIVASTIYFLMRRIFFQEVRRVSAPANYLFPAIVALPYLSGYFLAHGTLDAVPFFQENLWTVHVLTGEAMLFVATFLFYRTTLDTEKCTGCGTCVLNCPTATLESKDRGRVRAFSYSHYQCILCARCVKTCPEEAAGVQHEVRVSGLFQLFAKREIRSVTMSACVGCGSLFVPEPQMEKISEAIAGDFLRFCAPCRRLNLKNIVCKRGPFQAGRRPTSTTNQGFRGE